MHIIIKLRLFPKNIANRTKAWYDDRGDKCMRYFDFSAPDIYVSHTWTEKPSQKYFNMHSHVHTELYCFIKGQAVYNVEGTVYPLLPGDILIMRPGEAHRVLMDEGVAYERICVHFDTAILDSLDPERVLTKAVFQRRAGTRNHYRLGQAGLDAMKRMTAHNTRMHILGNLILLLQTISEQFSVGQAHTTESDTLEFRVIHYINKYLDRDLTLQKLCDRFFVSRTQLCRLFKQMTGTSVGRYITCKRLLMARQWLLQGIKPTQVYAACGYSDYSTFFRAYTKFFGHSPRQEQEGSYPLTPNTMISIGQNAGVLAYEDLAGI